MEVRSVYIDASPLSAEVVREKGKSPGLVVFEGDPSPEELRGLVAPASIVVNGHTRMDAKLIEAAPHLRSIIYLGTGASSSIDMAVAERRGIKVRTIRGYGDRTVAEHGFALLMAAAREIVATDREMRAGIWAARFCLELKGLTLGLIGLGGVGAEMARIADGFGMRVVAWNRSGIPDGVPAEAMGLDALLAQSDAVSLHLALTEETRGILSAARIGMMKPGVILINTARAGLVDGAALLAALKERRIGHAGLDVFEPEPLPKDDPLTTLDNVTLTPHAAWKSMAAARRLIESGLHLLAADEAALRAGQPLKG